ncbi:nuclear receptor subfamily 1 group I member 3 isoform X3 [Microtus oregoni]|uniref:nuclear receptor subfamily 1 group I member 3 isoform X3 n=1 Tax=Microtus oregoni TaxID=111838 RepID=UPI001BB24C74|nr:nuclear receptor subfamily 1 group I member 3 isoform X3 [Microtus oregoni]XP_041518715.1 nuclear receptor subfamily 1 group I member 3 isoform X3 [Microtus oregoni]
MTAMLTLETMASGEEYEPRNCVVCGDRATGYHFHALTCEGCKGFFRRTVSKNTGPICPFSGSCEVSKDQRRHCPACRLQKCLNAGMRKDMILSAEALALRRARQAQRRAQKASLQLSQEQKELVQTLLGAHTRHVVPMFGQLVKFRPPPHLFVHHRPFPTLVPVMPLRTHFADVNTFMVQQIIKFTKELPLFRALPMEDQISLLKGAAVEILHISLNLTFCLQTQNFLCGPLCYRVEDAVHDRPGVTQREEIDQLQEEMALILNNYIKEQQRPQSRFLYAKLMGLLAELRSINNAYSYEIQRIQGLSAMMPLLGEIFS